MKKVLVNKLSTENGLGFIGCWRGSLKPVKFEELTKVVSQMIFSLRCYLQFDKLKHFTEVQGTRQRNLPLKIVIGC
jgi:hypothetical protein